MSFVTGLVVAALLLLTVVVAPLLIKAFGAIRPRAQSASAASPSAAPAATNGNINVPQTVKNHPWMVAGAFIGLSLIVPWWLGMSWGNGIAVVILAWGALYTIYRYFQKSDGRLAAAVGGWLVIGGVILAILFLIIGDNLSTKLIVTGLEGTRSMLDPADRDGGGQGCSIDANLTRVGEQKQFTYSPGCKITVSSCTQGPTLLPAEHGKIKAALGGQNPYSLMTHFGYEVKIGTPFDDALQKAGLQSIPVLFKKVGAC